MGWEYGTYNKMLRHISNANKLSLEVGIVTPKKHAHKKTGKVIDMAYLMQIHEEGKGNNPKRPTLRPSVLQRSQKRNAKALTIGLLGGHYMMAYTVMGEELAKNARLSMMRLKSPKIKRTTSLRRVNKGTTNPLVDTGHLIRSIGYKIK